jgi:hypothetical protein
MMFLYLMRNILKYHSSNALRTKKSIRVEKRRKTQIALCKPN